MRVKELPTICIGMISIIAGTATQVMVTFIGHIILSVGELHVMQSLMQEIFATK